MPQYSGGRQSLDRAWQIFQNYSTRQMVVRLLKRAQARLVTHKIPGQHHAFQLRHNDRFAKLLELRLRHRLPERVQRAGNQIPRGEITLLNESRALGLPQEWRAKSEPAPSHLWRFQLHYHEYLLDLAADPQRRFDSLVFDIIDGWLQAMSDPASTPDADAWHPFCISRRIPVWLMLLAHDADDQPRRGRFQSSAAVQLEFLSRNLETDLRGNHLLENLHALGMGAAFFTGAAATRWAEISSARLATELATQILPSGEHYERSPMYQCVVLANLLQLAIVSVDVLPRLHALAMSFAEPMLGFIVGLLHCDGEIPLFSDSCFGESPSIAEIFELAELAGIDRPRAPQGSRQIGDYWVHRDDRDNCLIWDCGQVAAHGLPGHGHCDLLNFEASLAGRRFFVDSGNFSYEDDSMRRYCRSSVAHNVLTIDDRDHCDVWSIFRMGFRGSPQSFRQGSQGGFQWATASHNAYHRIGVPKVTRLFACGPEQIWLCVDHVPNANHRLSALLHVAPGVIVEQSSAAATRFCCTIADQNPVILDILGAEYAQIVDGWYCEQFGHRIRNSAIEYATSSTHSCLLGWVLRPSDVTAEIQFDQDPTNPTVKLDTASETIQFKIDQP